MRCDWLGAVNDPDDFVAHEGFVDEHVAGVGNEVVGVRAHRVAGDKDDFPGQPIVRPR